MWELHAARVLSDSIGAIPRKLQAFLRAVRARLEMSRLSSDKHAVTPARRPLPRFRHYLRVPIARLDPILPSLVLLRAPYAVLVHTDLSVDQIVDAAECATPDTGVPRGRRVPLRLPVDHDPCSVRLTPRHRRRCRTACTPHARSTGPI